MAICAFQFYIPQLMILIVESFHVKDGTLRKMLGKDIMNIIQTVFTQIVSAETILFWIWPYLLWPLTFTSYTWIVAAETIQGRKLFKGGNYSRKYGMRA